MSDERIATIGDFLQNILTFLQGGVGPFGLAQTIFALAGLWALLRIRQPLRAAYDDLQTVRDAPSWVVGCPEEMIATERVRNLRVRLVGAIWIVTTGVLYLLPGTHWLPVASRSYRLFLGLWLTIGLLAAAIAMGLAATETERTRVRLAAAMDKREAELRAQGQEKERQHDARHSAPEPPVLTPYDIDANAAAHLWQKAFTDLAALHHLSTPDALDLLRFPPAYLRQMGLDGPAIDVTATLVDAITQENKEEETP
jgi:hypothetical protein